MNQRDKFIDAMGMISPKYVAAYIERVQPTGIRKYRPYFTSIGIYVAACLLVILLVPIIILNVSNTPPRNDPPGLAPVTVAPADTTVDTEDETEPTETTETETEESIDIEELLADYTVYDVTVETYLTPLDNTDKPEKIALRFTDFDGFTVFVTPGEYTAEAFVYGLNKVECEPTISLAERDFSILFGNGIISVYDLQNGGGFNPSKKAYLFSNWEYAVIPASRKTDGSEMLELRESNGRLYYSYYQRSLYSAVEITGIMQDHISSDSIYCESGEVVLRYGIPTLEKTHQETVGEWYASTGFPAKQFRDKYQIPTYEDMLEWYKTDYEGFMKAYMSNLEPEPVIPEFDINSEECLMYRLLDMTVEEIEAEFGEMTFCGLVGGGTPCYEIPKIGIQLLYYWETQDIENPVLKDQCPRWVETVGYDGVVYPGIYVGMDSKEFADLISVDHVSFSMADFFPGFSSSCSFDGHSIIVLWNVPDELALKIEEVILWKDGSEEDAARAELLDAIKSGGADITVGRITIS